MNVAGYYLTDPDDLVSFPTGERWGSLPIGTERDNINLKTTGGVRYVYPLSKVQVLKLTFRVTEEELAIFQTLDDAVNGDVTAFYFVPDTDNPSVVLHVRKETNFSPKQLDEPASIDAETVAMYDYTLELTTEVDPIDLEP